MKNTILYLLIFTSILISCDKDKVETQPRVHCDLEFNNFEMQNGGLWTKIFTNDSVEKISNKYYVYFTNKDSQDERIVIEIYSADNKELITTIGQAFEDKKDQSPAWNSQNLYMFFYNPNDMSKINYGYFWTSICINVDNGKFGMGCTLKLHNSDGVQPSTSGGPLYCNIGVKDSRVKRN